MTLLYTLMLIGFVGVLVILIVKLLTPKQWSTRIVRYTYGDTRTRYEVEQYDRGMWNNKGKIFFTIEEAIAKKKFIDKLESATKVVSKKVIFK